ncbi:MAG: hypothetical protein ACP5PQ_03505 [Thermoproteota archaeon]
MLRSLLEDEAGISSIIEAVLITAVGIVVAIAVMLWISGLTSSLLSYENIGVSGSSCYLDADEEVFRVQIRLKNTGASTRINDVLVNSIPIRSLEGVGMSWMVEGGESGNGLPIPLATGVNVDLNLAIPDGTPYGGGVLTSGVTVNIVLHSNNGADYTVGVTLP